MPDDVLEPFRGTYDWDEAFEQNPGLPVYPVSDQQRWRVHGVRIAPPRKPADTGSFSTV